MGKQNVMTKFVENHERGIKLSSVLVPLFAIMVLAFTLLGNTNDLFRDYTLVWYGLTQACIISVASTSANARLKKLLYCISVVMLVMAAMIDAEMAVALPAALFLVLNLLNRLYKSNLLISFSFGAVVAIATGQCIAWHSGEGMEFAITSVSFLMCSYIVAWCAYLLGGLVDVFPEPVRRFLSEDE